MQPTAPASVRRDAEAERSLFLYMFREKHLIPAAIVIPAALVLGAAASGCKPSGESASGGNDAALIATGKTVYATHGCANCHAIDGRGGWKAPELTKVGAEAEHTAEWLVAHVLNPRAHNPGSKMPGFEGKIDDKELLALGAPRQPEIGSTGGRRGEFTPLRVGGVTDSWEGRLRLQESAAGRGRPKPPFNRFSTVLSSLSQHNTRRTFQ